MVLQRVLVLHTASETLKGLVETQITELLIQLIFKGTYEFSFLARSQLILILLIWDHTLRTVATWPHSCLYLSCWISPLIYLGICWAVVPRLLVSPPLQTSMHITLHNYSRLLVKLSSFCYANVVSLPLLMSLTARIRPQKMTSPKYTHENMHFPQPFYRLLPHNTLCKIKASRLQKIDLYFKAVFIFLIINKLLKKFWN